MKAVPAALIGSLLSSVALGLAQEAGTDAQPAAKIVYSMIRDVAGSLPSRRIRLEGAVDSANLRGCHDPANIEWGRLFGFTAERAVLYRLGSPDLVRILDLNAGSSRYGLRLPSSRLGLVQGKDDGARVTSSVTVIDGASERPVSGAQVLFLADHGGFEPLLCLLDTDSDGTAVLPLARRVFGTVVAAKGFVGGVVTPDRSGIVRLRRSKTLSGRVEDDRPLSGHDQVVAVPQGKPGARDEEIIAAATIGPGGAFELDGIPASTSRLLLAVLRMDFLIAAGVYRPSDSSTVIPVDDASVAFTSPDPEAQVELRLLELTDGTKAANYALGRIAQPRIRREGSRFSRKRLPAGRYQIRAYDRTLAEFSLARNENLDLGVLGDGEKFTLEVRGLDGRSGQVYWSRDLCFDDEVDGRTASATSGPLEPVLLWIPKGCKRIWGEVRAPGMVAAHFDWSRGQPLEAVVTLRPGFTITGTVLTPGRLPLRNARVDAFHESGLVMSREERLPDVEATAIADEDGRFDLTVAHPGSFFVRAVYANYFAPVHHVDVASGSTHDLEFEMKPGAAVTGVVRSPSGRPVAKATVRWCYRGREQIVVPASFAGVEGCRKQKPAWRDRAGTALWNLEGAQIIETDGGGMFRAHQGNVLTAALFTALPPGEVEFAVRPWGGYAESSIHTLEPGDNEIEITLRNGNRIEGEVLGLPEGSPTAEVHLAMGAEPDVWTRWATKTAEAVRGAFLFENIGVGPKHLHLYATAPGYRSLESRVVLQAGDGARAVTLKLVPNSSVIEGSIDPFELGSEPRLTAISRTAEERIAAIDAGGAFAFTDLPVGEWRLVLNHGAPSRHEQLTLRRRIALEHEGDRARLDIDLGSLPTLHFVGGEPGALTIHGLSEQDWVFGPVAAVAVDETGQATIHAPAPGNYRVSYQTRPGTDGTTRSYGLQDQWLEGSQTFHLDDFKSVEY